MFYTLHPFTSMYTNIILIIYGHNTEFYHDQYLEQLLMSHKVCSYVLI